MKTQTTGSSLVRRLMATILLLMHGSFVVAATTVTVHQGQELAGERVVLVVPIPAYEAAIGIARQVGTLPLQRGTLTVIETESIPKDDELAGFLAETLPAEPRPDWVWIHQGVVSTDQAGEKLTSPTIRFQAAEDQPVREAAKRSLGEGASVALIRPELPEEIAAAGVLGFTYPSGTPLSRQIRHTRLLVTTLLRSRQLLAADQDFCWRRLNGLAPRLIALYDAEGIGGGDRSIWNGSSPSNCRMWGSTGSVATTFAKAPWPPQRARSSRAAAAAGSATDCRRKGGRSSANSFRQAAVIWESVPARISPPAAWRIIFTPSG
jgi:hypothetical protein